MFNKANYKVYKTNKDTLLQSFKKVAYDDDYGSTTYKTIEEWKPFKSDLYFLEEKLDPMYSKGALTYYPIAPSGKYNVRYASLYAKVLKNLDYVGNFDGVNFDFELPYLNTSLHELFPLDVFYFDRDLTYRKGVFKQDPVITIPANTKLVLEYFDDIKFMKMLETAVVSELETGIKHSINGDLIVNKCGTIEIKRVYKENE